jgi:hypothetical protein
LCAAVTNSLTLTVAPPTSNPAALVNSGAININRFGPATPYGSPITAQCMDGLVTNVTVTLHGFSHAFPADVSVLLVGPDTNRAVVLMGGAGGAQTINNGVDLTFSDAVSNYLPINNYIVAGTYHPTNYLPNLVLPAPAPAGSFSTNLSVFNGINPAGTWLLYVYDSASGFGGRIANGWSLNIGWQPAGNSLLKPVKGGKTLSAGLAEPPFVRNAGVVDGRFQMEIWAAVGTTRVVEGSTNFINWMPLSTNKMEQSPEIFTDWDSERWPKRFYRVLLLPQ